MPRRVIIVGAGISGLSLGWFLKKRFGDEFDLTILEASGRPGGWIKSSRDQGFLFEEGPRSCRSRGAGAETLQLIEELGLCEEVISASPSARLRYLYWDDKLCPLPTGLFSFLTSSFAKDMIPALWKEWRTPAGKDDDESIKRFFDRRFGCLISEKYLDPLISGIYAGDIAKLSLRSCFPDWYVKEQEYGSLLKGFIKKQKAHMEFSPFVTLHQKTPIFTFKQGMETLPLALSEKLKSHIQLSSPVESIHKKGDGIEVRMKSGKILQGDVVYITAPARISSKLVASVSSEAAEEMSRQISATVAVVNLGWNENVLRQRGFGYLVPSCQKQKILGVVFDSSAFPGQSQCREQTRLTVMLGGMHHPEVAALCEEKLEAMACEAVKKHLGIPIAPHAIRVTLAKEAIPQYEVGHRARLERIETYLKKAASSKIILMGSSWRGVSVNDCIAEAKRKAGNFDYIV